MGVVNEIALVVLAMLEAAVLDIAALDIAALDITLVSIFFKQTPLIINNLPIIFIVRDISCRYPLSYHHHYESTL